MEAADQVGQIFVRREGVQGEQVIAGRDAVLPPDGLDVQPHEARLDVDAGFATSAEDDWSAARIGGDQALFVADWGGLPLRERTVKKQEAINIIQHPGGGPKQIALYHNVVVYSDERVVQYLTDTLPGSSGSPCFNDAWEVVALHHSGGWLREPGGKEDSPESMRRYRDIVAGMGLNLPADHVCFFEVEKFDGRQRRQLTPTEVRQTGGRAGRGPRATGSTAPRTTPPRSRSCASARSPLLFADPTPYRERHYDCVSPALDIRRARVPDRPVAPAPNRLAVHVRLFCAARRLIS